MAINSLGYKGTALGQAVLNINTQLTNLSTEMASGEKSTTYAGMGVNEWFLQDCGAVAAGQHLGVHRHHDQRQYHHLRGQHRVAGAVDPRRAGAELRGVFAGRSGQHRTDHRAGDCRRRAVVDDRYPQHPIRRSLYIFRQRDQHAADRHSRQYHQWHHHPGRLEAGDGGARAGRRHHRAWPSADFGAGDDPDYDQRRQRGFAVRHETGFSVVVADRRHRDRPCRLAGRGFDCARRHQSEPGRSGEFYVQPSRRHHRFLSADRVELQSAAGRRLYHRHHPGPDQRQFERGAENRDRHHRQYVAGGRLRGRGRQ